MAGLIRASRTDSSRRAARARRAVRLAAVGRLARRFGRSPSAILGTLLTVTLVAVAALADVLAPHDPLAIVGPPLGAPDAAFLMGTDDLGRDLLSGIILGARTSLAVAAGVGALVLAIGLPIGIVAGYRGGVVDDLLMRFTELFQVLPRFFLAIVVIALFGPGLDRLIVVLGVTSWPEVARIVRAQTLSLREREFIDAARALGSSQPRLIRHELLPNVIPATAVILALVMGQVLLIEASLGFLGLGDPNAISWGYLAGQAQRFLRVAWWLSVFPGVALILAVLAFNLLSDGLNDQVDRRW
ncbi:MAG: ABC transporter permease [Chloroflexi bacterium]|nr:ABC transporter permease [Chloroflexota bacterium]